MSKLQRVRGTQDMVGEDAARFDTVVDAFRRVGRLFGFRPVHTPVFEPTPVFARSLGETSDVVGKEMYSFDDRGGDPLTLRPEFTAGIARAYLQNGWQQLSPLKLAAHGPVFRYERPQKGRFRQFHQIDAEVLGAGEPAADVELIAFGAHLIAELGVAEGVTLQLNTLGDAATRDAWRAALVAHFGAHRDALSADSQERLGRNPLRILDSKDPGDRAVAADAPVIDAYLTAEAGAFFAAVTRGLEASGVAWTRSAGLVRGLDYYRHTAFEFVTDRLGAQGTVLAGGRYDGLFAALGGPGVPAVGWAGGIERLAMLLDAPPAEAVRVAVVPLSPSAEPEALRVLSELRAAGISAEQAWRGNLKRRMEKAGASGAGWAVLIGEDELSAGEVALRDMRDGGQRRVAGDGLVAVLRDNHSSPSPHGASAPRGEGEERTRRFGV